MKAKEFFNFLSVNTILITSIFFLTNCSTNAKLPMRSVAGESPTFTGTRSINQKQYPIQVVGGDDTSFTPTNPSGNTAPTVDPKSYDVIVIGGGLAGLAASVYITDQGKKVLLIEKESYLGGLAAGAISASGIQYDRGAAYWTSPYDEELAILKHIGLGNYEKKFPIPEPIDTYLLNNTMYGHYPFEGIWDERTLGNVKSTELNQFQNPVLPASFAVFKHELKMADHEKLIPNQPFEEFDNQILDTMDAATWIRSMAQSIQKRAGKLQQNGIVENLSAEDLTTKQLAERFQNEIDSGKLDRNDPMKDVVGLMDLYCRSALGANADKISAMAFANFYISEIETRYTTQIGTGKAAQKMAAILSQRPNLFFKRLNSPVAKVINLKNKVSVQFFDKSQMYVSTAKYVVFSAQLGLAPKLIEGFKEQAGEQAKLMSQLGYSHYSVHALEVTGHPYRSSYDTWVRNEHYRPDHFTDMIIGRWMDPVISGYSQNNEHNDFSKNPDDKGSILTIYHPVAIVDVGAYSDQRAAQLAEIAVNDMDQEFKDYFGQNFEIKKVDTNRWPFSVHIPEPGHYKFKAKILRKPFGHIYFANNNIGTPAFEEALFRGHCGAVNVLLKLDPKYKKEQWSQCPVD